MEAPHYAMGLKLSDEGVWISRDSGKLSYPEEGNARCFLIEDKSFWFQHRNNCIVTAIRRYPPSGPILDVGGGNGYVTRRLLDENYESVLVEPGPVGAYNGKKERKIPNVFCSTLEGCNFPHNSVHAIGLFDVLEHVEDEVAFLNTIHAALKLGGHLYLTVPAYNFLWSSSDDSAGHYRRYSPQKLVKVLNNSFQIQFITCFFTPLVLPLLAFRVFPYRCKLSKGGTRILSADAEHGTRGGISVLLIKKLLLSECKNIEIGKFKAWGTSCLCIATKTK